MKGPRRLALLSGPRADQAEAVVRRLAPELVERAEGSHVLPTFMRGLTIGALVGAAIAGSALWSRRRRDSAETPETPERPTD